MSKPPATTEVEAPPDSDVLVVHFSARCCKSPCRRRPVCIAIVVTSGPAQFSTAQMCQQHFEQEIKANGSALRH